MSKNTTYKNIEIIFLKDKTIFMNMHSSDRFITYKPINKKESINLIDKGYIIFEGRSNTYGDLSKYFNRFGYID
tara:strand:- start:525 stop:746 length:222 start_codon:yes stop_codon:yes gene_type:complete